MMKPRFPLSDVIVRKVKTNRKVEKPEYADNLWQMNQTEFAMQIEGVGSFYACNGKEVEYSPEPGAANRTVELYLNGSVYGAILHQRQILPLHGSSFIHSGNAVLICGESGAGKSAIVADFCLNGNEFLTDDVTPVIIEENKPYILTLSDRLKLWGNTLEQLGIDKNQLNRIDDETDKYYYRFKKSAGKKVLLKMILILEIHDKSGLEFKEVTGAEKFLKLRNEIYRPEYLQGMKENEKVFFRQISALSNNLNIFNVMRPGNIEISRMRSEIENYINQR
ncbi:MAG: hypothetical protein HPY62_08355 [Bacteroidales bacterium]|nr:hypothetical protein [Bacteroidales bacterium]